MSSWIILALPLTLGIIMGIIIEIWIARKKKAVEQEALELQGRYFTLVQCQQGSGSRIYWFENKKEEESYRRIVLEITKSHTHYEKFLFLLEGDSVILEFDEWAYRGIIPRIPKLEEMLKPCYWRKRQGEK